MSCFAMRGFVAYFLCNFLLMGDGSLARQVYATLKYRGPLMPAATSLTTKSTRSVIGCVRECLSHGECTSVMYNQDGQQCWLYSYVYSVTETSAVEGAQWIYFSFIKECPAEKNYEYTGELDYCVRYIDYPMTHDEGVNICEQDGAGLIIIDSLEKQQQISHFLGLMTNPPSNIYIDGSDQQDEGVWMWSDGRTMTYNNWNSYFHQPDGGIDENYILTYRDNNGGYLWSDVIGHNRYPVLCEI